MVVGILGALAQSDIKRLLSFTLVSHIGYMVFGLAMSSVAGLGAAVFYVAHHITIQTSLFLVTGLIERRGGSSSVDRLAGLAKLSPAAGGPVLRARHEPGRHPAVLRVPGQARPAPGRRRTGHSAGLRPGDRRRADQPADPAGRGEGLEPRVLAQARGRRAPRPRAAGGAGGLGHRPPGRPRQRDPAAPDHGGLHPGPGGAWRGPDGLRRAAVQGRGPGGPGDAGQVLLHPGRARRGRARRSSRWR